MVGFIILAAALVAFVIWAFYATYMDVKKATKADEDWLKEEKVKPKSQVVFILESGEEFSSGFIEPRVISPGSDYSMRLSSRHLAEKILESCYSDGYFYDETRKTYPSCRVKIAMVK